MYRKFIKIDYAILLVLFINIANAQQYQVQSINTGQQQNFRGLSAVSGSVVWVSGRGAIGLTLNGGVTWQWKPVTGYDSIEFRDIEAFSATEAVIMGIASPGYILKTTDGGNTWKQVYENTRKEIFMDAMHFNKKGKGMVIGDPLDSSFFCVTTYNRGNSWQLFKINQRPVKTNEAFFAASGTNLVFKNFKKWILVTGGGASRLIRHKSATPIPFELVTEYSGANSVCLTGKRMKNILVAGGDFTRPDVAGNNIFITKNGGSSWQQPQKPPVGYRSCITAVNKKLLVTCGLNGVDISEDGGNTWQKISDESYNVCLKAPKSSTVFLAGSKGKIGILQL